MARLRICRACILSRRDVWQLACLVLALLAGVAALLRRFVLDAADPYKCDALVNNGQWLQSVHDTHPDPSFKIWQTPGCLLHDYQSHELMRCLVQERVLFIGDSTIRQIFWATAKKLSPDDATQAMRRAEMHSSISFSRQGVTLDFVWDPFLNSTQLKDELDRSNNSSKGNSAIVLIGGGLWHARHLATNVLRDFRHSIDNVLPFMHRPRGSVPAKTEKDGQSVTDEGSGDLILLVPVQVPWYASLTGDRRAYIQPDTIDEMNTYLRDVTLATQADILWSFHRMTRDQEEAYEDSGIHVIDEVADKRADIILNMKCNQRTLDTANNDNGADRTCCSGYRPPTWAQWALLVPGMLILSSLYILRLFLHCLGGWTSPGSPSKASVIFLFAICYCFYADRTQIFNKLHKQYSLLTFDSLCGIITLLGICTVRRSMTRIPSSPDSAPDQPLLPRDQTDEWKGWMQFLILVYHYTGASTQLWIYEIIRVMVASYLFLTGFGHTVYFLRKDDYSLRRVAGVLVRLNLLSCALPYIMNANYLMYYFAPLVSFWFLVVYFTLKIGHRRNSSLRFLMGKLLLSAVTITAFNRIHGPLEILFKIIRYLGRANWNVVEWRFRVDLDFLIVYVGMLAAVIFVNLTSGTAQQYGLLRLVQHYLTPIQVVSTVVSLFILPGYFVLIQNFPDKYAYNSWHGWISPLPILAFVVLRNSHRVLRIYHSSVFAWLGRCSLETFTLQFHIWLAGDTKGLLSIGFLDRDGDYSMARWLEFIIITIVFLWASLHVASATTVITTWILGPEKRKMELRRNVMPEAEAKGSVDLSSHGLLDQDWMVLDAENEGTRRPSLLQKAHRVFDEDLRVRLGLIGLFLWGFNLVYK